ncbi:MAG: ABC transporter ATP-binding protein [Alphaproteobacteria bacterium]
MTAPPPSAATPKIEIRDLHKSFGNKKVLCGIDLDIGVAESVVVIGGSGTGKSVLLKCVLGLLRPERGSIKIDGEEVIGLPARERERINRKIGMLFQSGALFDSLTVWENIAFGMIEGRGVARQEAKPIALEKLASVGLGPEVGEIWPAELSGGMKKRVALARAIATEPEIIFFELGATALSITHDMASARKIADRVAMLHDGRIIWAGPVAEIDHADNAHVDQFIHGRAEGPIRMAVRQP